MDITYTLLANGMIRKGENTYIPDDQANRDWQEFQRWVDDGGKAEVAPESEPPPLPGPSVLDLRQRIELLEAKLNN